jgi:hypothetical protein
MTSAAASLRHFDGGWVEGAERMRPGADGFCSPACLTFGPGDFEQAHAALARLA